MESMHNETATNSVGHHVNGTAKMLTARDIQAMLHIDRSTVYRLAESGRLPAIKVGRQWRFPADQIHARFKKHLIPEKPEVDPFEISRPLEKSPELSDLLSWEWLQVIQVTFAELLGVMLVVTDTNGEPVHQPANPCGLFTAFMDQADAMPRFISHWQKLATTVDLTPSFQTSHLGLLCARSLIAVGTEIKGMVIAGCVAPAEWPPNPVQIAAISDHFQVTTEFVSKSIHDVYFLDDAKQVQILSTLPRIAALIAHVVNDRKMLMDRLSTIANLTQFNL